VAIHNQTSRCRSVGTRRPAPDHQVVDRQFNPRRYDAAQAIQSFSARLRDQIDLDTLTSELVAVVQQTIQPTQASIWLRLGSAPTPRHQPGTTAIGAYSCRGSEYPRHRRALPQPGFTTPTRSLLLNRSASCFALMTALSAWQLSTLDRALLTCVSAG
jgi:hypothetical protein